MGHRDAVLNCKRCVELDQSMREATTVSNVQADSQALGLDLLVFLDDSITIIHLTDDMFRWLIF